MHYIFNRFFSFNLQKEDKMLNYKLKFRREFFYIPNDFSMKIAQIKKCTNFKIKNIVQNIMHLFT